MNKEKGNQKLKIFILVFVIVLLLGVIATLIVLLLKPKDVEEKTKEPSNKLVYQSDVIVDDPEALQDAVNELFEKAKEGQMALEMKTEAYSSDGKTFDCYLANSVKNSYDMFIVFYRDDTQEEIYRTGVIPVGARIESFTLEKALELGTHDITIVYNQVENDMETIHAQVNVGMILVVN